MSPVPAWKVYTVLAAVFSVVLYAGSMAPRDGEKAVSPVADAAS